MKFACDRIPPQTLEMRQMAYVERLVQDTKKEVVSLVFIYFFLFLCHLFSFSPPVCLPGA